MKDSPTELDARGQNDRNPPGLSPLERRFVSEFDNPRREWRRLFCETFGTFLLVVSSAGAGVVDFATQGEIGRVASIVTPGLVVLVVILSMGTVSGAHLNPAVSIAFALRGDFRWWRVPGYIAAQLVGAIAAALLLVAVFGDTGTAALTLPGPAFTDGQAFIVEALLTLGLVSTILGAASGAQNIGALSAFAVGAYICLAGLWASPVSGASMNPARSFGPALISGEFGRLWIYAAGPLAGAVVAVGIAFVLRGRGGGRTSTRAAQGDPQ